MRGRQKSHGAPQSRHGYRPVRVKRVFEEVCTQIRHQIMAGTLGPGDKLPPERDLALQFGVGRAAVREALRSLENSGVVKLTKGVKGGAYIQHVDPRVVATSVGDMVSLGTVSLEMLIETRILLVVPAVELACKRATESDFAAIEDNIRKTEEAQGLHDRLLCSRAFYSALTRASHNQLLQTLVDATNEVIFDLIEEFAPPLMPDVTRRRRKILQFLRERNAAKAGKEAELQLEELLTYLLANVKRVAKSA